MSVNQVHQLSDRGSRFRPPSRRRVRVWIVVGIFLGFVAVAWAWAFQRAPGHGGGADIPLLTSGDQPTRQKPDDPGGMKVADIDPLQYDSGRNAPRVENILPAPEAPLPQPKPDRHIAAAPPPATDTTPEDATSQQRQEVADAAPVGPPVKLVPGEPAPAKPIPAVVAPIPAPPAAKRAPKPAVKPPVKPAIAEPKPKVKPLPVGAGSYRLQLASLRSDNDARTVSAKLKREYGDVLGAVSFSIVSANIPGRGTYYRVMAGPMSQGSASQICDSLRKRGAACLLAR